MPCPPGPAHEQLWADVRVFASLDSKSTVALTASNVAKTANKSKV